MMNSKYIIFCSLVNCVLVQGTRNCPKIKTINRSVRDVSIKIDLCFYLTRLAYTVFICVLNYTLKLPIIQKKIEVALKKRLRFPKMYRLKPLEAIVLML